MQPFVCSYCSDWPQQRYTILPPWGLPVFILPFEMLLQLPEQKLHSHLVMALHSYSPCSHGAVRRRNHIHSKVTEQCVPERLCFVFSNTPRSFLNLANRSGSRPIRASVNAAAQGIKGSMPGYDDCVCVLLIFPLSMSSICV